MRPAAVRRRSAWCAACVLLGLAGAATASPSDVGGPTVSRDAKWKMTLEYKDDARRNWTLPKLAFSRPLSETFEGEIALSRTVNARPGGRADSGVGDVEVKGKWALLQGDGGARPGIALEPKLILPAGSTGSGHGVDDAHFELPVLVGWRLGKADVFTKAGYRDGFGIARDGRRFMGGVLLAYRPVETLRLGVDVYAEVPRHERDAYRLSANAGANLYLGRSFELQALVGKAVRHPQGEDAYKVKLVLEYKFGLAG